MLELKDKGYVTAYASRTLSIDPSLIDCMQYDIELETGCKLPPITEQLIEDSWKGNDNSELDKVYGNVPLSILINDFLIDCLDEESYRITEVDNYQMTDCEIIREDE